MINDEKILLFAGTTEGRRLFEQLTEHSIPVDVCVATEYGKELLDRNSNNIFAKRLNLSEMKELIQKNNYSIVVDATHPYATLVTQNIKIACQDLAIRYIRLLRTESDCKDVIYCETILEAVEFLSQHQGNVLSTIGSKELKNFTVLAEFQKRIFARILPLPEAVNMCFEMGFQGSNLICMQGPFSYEMNIATLKQFDCRYLLTKNSGAVGGFEEKLKAARDTGTKLIVIGRPTKEVGLSFNEALSFLLNKESISQDNERALKDFFPLFLNISNKTAIVIGGGKIATRRVETLAKFRCRIKVIAPNISWELAQLKKSERIECQMRTFEEQDLDDAFLVVGATNDRAVNRTIGALAREKGIYHSIADCKEECSFFFPAVVLADETVIGITAEGKSHKAAAIMADKIRRLRDES